MAEIGSITCKVTPVFDEATLASLRPEEWQRDGKVLAVIMDEPGVVKVSIEMFRQMLTEMGFERVED